MAAWVDREQVKRSKAYVAKVAKEQPASWLQGEVKRHCVQCEAEVDGEGRTCPSCSAPLRKECPRCHFWVELDASTCLSCRYYFLLPLPKKATVKLWHASEQ
jgi:hypothetical protein